MHHYYHQSKGNPKATQLEEKKRQSGLKISLIVRHAQNKG